MALDAGHDLGGCSASAPAVLTMQVVVANVLSLSPKEERDGGVGQLEITSRMEELQSLLTVQGVHVAAVLESRLPGKGLGHTRDYFIISGGCKPGGTHGTQLWISKTLRPSAAGRPTALQPRQFLIVEASPYQGSCLGSAREVSAGCDRHARAALRF